LQLLFRVSVFFLFTLINLKAAILSPHPTPAQGMQVARGICAIRAGYLTKFDHLVNTILADHSRGGHGANDSYFRTSDKRKIERIVKRILNHADNARVERNPINGKVKLILEKVFSTYRSRRLVGRSYLGYTRPDRITHHRHKTNNARLIFDITNVNTPADYVRGAAYTGYPY